MSKDIPSDFVRHCEKDLSEWNKEIDQAKKLHLLRRINFQMYEKACEL